MGTWQLGHPLPFDFNEENKKLWKIRMEGRREKSCFIIVRWDIIFLKIYCFEVPEGLPLVRH